MKNYFYITILAGMLIFVIGCQSSPKKDQESSSVNNTKTESPKEQDNPLKKETYTLIQDRKFFDAYQLLAKQEPKTDWAVAHMLFTASFLKRIGELPGNPGNQENQRQKATQLMQNGKYYESLEIFFQIEPKTDEDIAGMLAASQKMFEESGGNEISRHLAITMAGFLHARAKDNKAMEKQFADNLAQQVDDEKYKKSLVKAARFFKGLGNDFEELITRHLEKEGYDLIQIQTGDKKKLLQEKKDAGDKYSGTYLWWYNSYQDFEQLVSKLLMDV